MPDSKENRNSPDSRRINLDEPYEVQYWSERFGVSPNQLRKAVEQAGTSSAAVENFLKSNMGNTSARG